MSTKPFTTAQTCTTLQGMTQATKTRCNNCGTTKITHRRVLVCAVCDWITRWPSIRDRHPVEPRPILDLTDPREAGDPR